jgi:hypothetical protein
MIEPLENYGNMAGQFMIFSQNGNIIAYSGLFVVTAFHILLSIYLTLISKLLFLLVKC